MPLFEAVVNSIHAIAEIGGDPVWGRITIEVIRLPQDALQFQDEASRRSLPIQEPIIGFKIMDNGAGFHDGNMASFETLDSEYKAHQGCRGVGRLLWLKAFEAVAVVSEFADEAGEIKRRSFNFTAARGVSDVRLEGVDRDTPLQTCVHLSGFQIPYRERSAKTAGRIAAKLFEHCLWYFVREEGAPGILIKDAQESIDLKDIFRDYMFSSSKKQSIRIKGNHFELTHLKLKAGVVKQHFLAWCAGSRVVKEESIIGKVSGLHGRIKDKAGDFIYACYVASPFLDLHVRPERIGFDIEEMSEDLFSETELSLDAIRTAVMHAASEYLACHLHENRKAGRERVANFVSVRAPRYRPILGRIPLDKLSVDPGISDRDLDILLHKQLSEIESSLLAEGHDVMNFIKHESPAQYRTRLLSYLEKAEDIKKSDLASYVFHRKIILDILENAIQRGPDGKYVKEELIHEIIMPMRKTSNEVHPDSCNLWLIDERLAFHDFLSSDKPLSTMPITGCADAKEPDICALNVFDKPILVAEGKRVPLASIVIVEIKRPMRNDATAGGEKDPIEQALGYLDRIREGKATTASGRPIPRSEEIPGFCYAICDLTATVERRCKTLDLTPTSDHLGYFGYNANYKAYIEVISFDRLLNAAKERNRAFFDRLGLPTM